VKDVVTDPDSASNASDDAMLSVLEDHSDDPVVAELKAAIFGLNEDEQDDLVTPGLARPRRRRRRGLGRFARRGDAGPQQTHGVISARHAAVVGLPGRGAVPTRDGIRRRIFDVSGFLAGRREGLSERDDWIEVACWKGSNGTHRTDHLSARICRDRAWWRSTVAAFVSRPLPALDLAHEGRRTAKAAAATARRRCRAHSPRPASWAIAALLDRRAWTRPSDFHLLLRMRPSRAWPRTRTMTAAGSTLSSLPPAFEHFPTTLTP
jgi:hypothetical protein